MNNYVTKTGLTVAVAVAGLTLSGCVSTDTFNAHVEEANARHNALSTRVDTVNQAVQAAQTRADAAYTLAEGQFSMAEVGRESVRFDTGKSALTDEAKATLTALAARLKSENKNVYLEVRGHTDMRGGMVTNRQLGRERAGNTARFLVDQGVPGNKVQVGSWGEDTPRAAGKTSDDLAENRRVDVIIFK